MRGVGGSYTWGSHVLFLWRQDLPVCSTTYVSTDQEAHPSFRCPECSLAFHDIGLIHGIACHMNWLNLHLSSPPQRLGGSGWHHWAQKSSPWITCWSFLEGVDKMTRVVKEVMMHSLFPLIIREFCHISFSCFFTPVWRWWNSDLKNLYCFWLKRLWFHEVHGL